MLESGRRLGSYEIREPIGAGGMGERFTRRRTNASTAQRFLMVTADDGTGDSRSFRMVVVEHWFEELKSRVPTDN